MFQVIFHCHIHQKSDDHKQFFEQTFLQEIVRMAVKYYTNHLRIKDKEC